MPYIIRRVVLQDFLSHRETRVSFGPGITVLVGENGAGKSSIVDAIYYLLALPAQERDLRGGKSNLVRRQSRTGAATIVLELEDPSSGRRMQVRAVLARRGAGRGGVSVVVNGVRRASTLEEARRVVAEELGIDVGGLQRIVKHSVVLRQNGLQGIIDIFSGGSRERKKRFLSELFGIEDYRRAKERLAGLEVSVDGEIVTGPAQARSLERSIREARSEIERLEREIRDNTGKLEELSREAERLRAEKEKLQARVQELEEKRRELSQKGAMLEAEIRALKDRILEAERAMREYERSGCPRLSREIEEAREARDKLEAIKEELDKARERLAELREKKARAEQEAQRLEQARQVLRDWLEKLGGERPSRVIEEHSRLQEERDRALRELHTLSSRLDGLASTLQRVEDAAGRLARELGREQAGPEQLLSAAQSLAATLREQAQAKREEAKRLLVEAGRLEGLARDKEEKAGILERDLGAGRCPLCGRELSRAEAEGLVARLHREAGELRARASQARRRAARLEEEADGLEARASRLERLAHTLHDRLQALERLGYPGYREAAGKRWELSRAVEELRERLGRLERQLREAAGRADEARRLLARLQGLGMDEESLDGSLLEQVEERLAHEWRGLESLESEAGELEERVRSLLGQASQVAGRTISGPAGLLAEIRRIAERLSRLESARDRCSGLRAIVEEARLEEARESLKSLEEERQRVAGALERVEAELGEARRGLQEADSRLHEAEKAGAALRARMEEARRRVGELRERLSRLERALWVARVMGVVRAVIDVAPEKLYRRKLHMLEEEASRVLSSMGTKYVEARAVEEDGDLRFVLTSREGTSVDLAQLSGGEQTAFGLALVLGINRMLAGNIGFLVLDEPTAHLDQEKRRMIAEILRELKGEGGLVDQVIIVTHERQLIDAADAVYEVRYEAGTSVVRELGPGGDEQ